MGETFGDRMGETAEFSRGEAVGEIPRVSEEISFDGADVRGDQSNEDISATASCMAPLLLVRSSPRRASSSVITFWIGKDEGKD